MPEKPIKLTQEEAERDPETKRLLLNLKKVFKKYIQKRDKFKCVLSGEARNIDVSHFLGVAGSKNERLAYDPRNAHIMAKRLHKMYHECNPLPYVRYMINTYGQDVVDQMEQDSKRYYRLTRDEIISLTNDLVARTKKLGDIKRWNESNSKKKVEDE